MFESAAIKTTPRRNPVLIASIFLLTGLGLVTLYSSSYAYAERFFGNGMYFFTRQALFCAAGILLFIVSAHVDIEALRKLIKPMVIAALILCILTFIPGIGVIRNGASRWIRIGSSTYQPSEMVKLVLPLYLAHILDKKQDSLNAFSKGILPPVLVSALFFALIYFQNNFSTAVFIALNALVILFLAGIRLRYFIAATFIFLPLSALLLLTKEHRVRRLISFVQPEWEPQGAGYQVKNSILAISSGGFWGKGIGQGTRKIASVPEVHSDFIFAAYSEEAGFLGILLFMILVTVFAVQGFKSALGSGSVFRRLLGAALVTTIVTQTLLNIAVVSGSLPATGIPLPFFSAGGSSLATTLISAGLIVNISRHREGSTVQEDLYGQ